MRMEFTDKQHSQRLSQQLNCQRRRGRRCNLEVRVGTHVFHAHREVLAAVSPSVEQELSGNDVQPQDAFVITISADCMSVEAVEQLLEFMYTGRILLGEHNVEYLLRGAQYFALSSLRSHCRDFLQQSLRGDNCLRHLALAEVHQLEEVAERAYCLLRDGFYALTAPQVGALSRPVLERLLRDQDLRVSGEDQVLLALAQWARGPPEAGKGEEMDKARLQAFESMFGHVLLSAVSEPALSTLMVDEILAKQCPTALARIQEELASRRNGLSSRMLLLQRKGALLDCVLVLGGQRTDGRFSNAVFAYVVSEDTWLKLTDMPYRAAAFGVTSLGKYVYLTGGASEETIGLRAAWRYDIDTGSWTKLPDLPQELVFHTMVTCGGAIYTVGGSVAPRKYTSNIYRYDLRKESWSLAGKMSVPMDGVEVITKEDKCIYIVTGRCVVKGAISRVGVVDCFDTTTHEVVQCMTFPIQFKHRPLLSFLDDNVLAVQSHKQSLEINLQKVQATKTAKTVPLMPGQVKLDICHAVCKLSGHKVFVCGGVVSREGEDGKSYTINQTACLFNMIKGEWSILAPAPEAVDCAACCCAQLPRKLLYKGGNQTENGKSTRTKS
ncbi:calicin isoform X1 [Pleurodeles waltl]|uniref:calicin isoform X1 n=1 Tax=Pleurodeles waltl TaxID=8319 RepID=UPI00370967E6